MLFSRCSYKGQLTSDQKRMHGRGIFTLSDGSHYVGTFHDGMFHGHGILFFTPKQGGGQFRGTWELGKCIGGDYIFSDGLKFSEEEWEYCTERDRRFWCEYMEFIKPVSSGKTAHKEHITPDYSDTNGIPPVFANGKPRKFSDVSNNFYTGPTAPVHVPECKEISETTGVPEDMAVIIAESREVQSVV
eukprot:Tbor_TRINITY_DN5332_c2_g2::TRINITY_DN5332_c2_g2_i2::g.5171::m.5171